MAREATHDDLDTLVELGSRFIQNISIDEVIEPATLRKTLTGMIEDPEAAIFMTDGGAIGAYMYPKYYNSKDIVAVEMFLYAEDGRGFELIGAFETWAKTQGANSTVLGSVPTKRSHILEKLYRRRGYEKREMSYARPMAV